MRFPVEAQTSLLTASNHIIPGNSYGHQYTSVTAILVESSALYTIWSIVFLGLYIVNNPIQFVFLASLAEVQVMALSLW